MPRGQIRFDLYRLNIVREEPDLFSQSFKTLSSDEQIAKVLEHAVHPDFKVEIEGARNVYEWAVRDFHEGKHFRGGKTHIVGLTLARSLVQTAGPIVQDDGIEDGESRPQPPVAVTSGLLLNMDRHILAVERAGDLLNSNRWRHALQDILAASAKDMELFGRVEFEPIPREEEIMKAFRSFSRITRLRLTLRLPNPELSRYSESLYREMKNGKIREYLQDMKSLEGISNSEEAIPYASAELAQSGYKKGPVKMSGMRNGKMETIETGTAAARGSVPVSRDYVRGLRDNARTKEGKRIAEAVLAEMDNVVPPPEASDEGQVE